MEIKKLKKATEVFKKIQELDKDVQELDKLAMLLVNNKMKVSFELRIEKFKGNQKKESEEIEDVVIHPLHYFQREFFGRMPSGETKSFSNKIDTSLNKTIPDTMALQILGVILDNNQMERQALLSQLENLGVKI